jgi:hypothetical protein
MQSKLAYRRSASFVRCGLNIGVFLMKKNELLPVANRLYVLKSLLEMRGKGFFRISLISILGCGLKHAGKLFLL